jgi:pimeloyl-ACP methyl ester carboxylesterase
LPNELSLRALGAGKRIVPVRREGSIAELGCSPLILLVHGYNSPEEKARLNFETFERGLRGADARAMAVGSVWHVHWPGDDPNPFISATMYPARVGDADNVARKLADWLLINVSSQQELRFVGHSLGCRVVLETLLALREHPPETRPRIGTVVLLAAAVPQVYCTEPPNPYPLPADGTRQHVHFSFEDSALGRKFDLGQRGYNEPGEAVGRDGRPAGRWTTATPTNLDHNDYWGSPRVQRDVARELQGALVSASPRVHGVSKTEPPSRRVAWREIVTRAVRRRFRA